MQADESLDGTTIRIACGDDLELRLPENPTTGFRWRVLSDGRPSLTLRDDAFVAASTRPGAPGEHRWTFAASVPGRAVIELAHERAWSAPSGAPRTYSLTVEVAPPA